MTDKEQIKKMARDLCGKSKFINGEYVCGMLNFKCNCHCNYGGYAESSINAGYRKESETAKEIYSFIVNYCDLEHRDITNIQTFIKEKFNVEID